MANGMFEKPKGQMHVEIVGAGATVCMRCVDTCESYDLLLGMDWLKARSTTAYFEKGEYFY